MAAGGICDALKQQAQGSIPATPTGKTLEEIKLWRKLSEMLPVTRNKE